MFQWLRRHCKCSTVSTREIYAFLLTPETYQNTRRRRYARGHHLAGEWQKRLFPDTEKKTKRLNLTRFPTGLPYGNPVIIVQREQDGLIAKYVEKAETDILKWSFRCRFSIIGRIKSRTNNTKKETNLTSYKEFRTHLFKMSQYKMQYCSQTRAIISLWAGMELTLTLRSPSDTCFAVQVNWSFMAD